MELRDSNLATSTAPAPRPAAPLTTSLGRTPERPAPISEPLLLAVLRKRWGLLLAALAASAAIAYVAADRLSSDSSVTYAALMHTGLPGGPGQTVYEPLSAKTCSELLVSSNLLEAALEQRGLEMPATAFAELLTVQQTRSSSLLGVELAWKDPADGIALLDSLLDAFIEQVAGIRRQTLSDYRKKHVELELFEARAAVDSVRADLRELRREQQQNVDDGGPSSDLYRSLLAEVANTQLSIDEKKAQLLGIRRQLEVLGQKKDALADRNRRVLNQIQQVVGEAASTQLTAIKQSYSEGSDAYQDVNECLARVAKVAKEEVIDVQSDLPLDVDQIRADLMLAVGGGSRAITELDHEEIMTAVDSAIGQWLGKANEIAEELRVVHRQHQDRTLAVIPVEDQITMLEARREDYQRKADEVGEQITGVESTRFEELESNLAEAEFRAQELAKQHDSMQQLERCIVSEWSKATPPSMSTTQVSSNNVKIFALTFVLCGLAVASPLLLAESLSRRPGPQAEFARAMRLPLIADQLLGEVSPSRHRFRRLEELDQHHTETVRRLALRLQQSTASAPSGAAVVFSGGDPTVSAMPLIAVVAQCLAERGERVLVVDAVSTGQSAIGLANVLGPGLAPAAGKNGKPAGKALTKAKQAKASASRGLAEYLAAECDDIGELIRPTGRQGIDTISGGERAFDREAMASGSLTRLIDSCRDRYSMILVNAPSTDRLADLQLISARADGVVLSVTKASATDQAARDAVHDMIELQTPIIGVVS